MTAFGPAGGDAIGGRTETWVLFLIDEQTYALRIWEVERIVRAVEVRALPQSPAHLRGIINVQGRVLPVVDLRLRFGKPSRDIRLEDHFIIASTPTVSAVLPVDAALGSLQVSGSQGPLKEESRDQCVREVLTFGSDVIYALDLDRVVYPEEGSEDWNPTTALPVLAQQ